MLTLLDIAKLNGTDALVGLIEEAILKTPEIEMGAARTIKGLNYKTRVRTAVPSVAFRGANEGTAVSQSTFEQRLVEVFLMNPIVEVDCAVANANEDGWEALMATEGSGIMAGALMQLAKVFYYGYDPTFGDVKGFPGLLQAYDSTNMVVDAGGGAASTGSSVWAVKFGPQDVQWVYGANGELNLSDVSIVRLTDLAGNPYSAYHQEILARPGLQVGSVYSVGRIKKLTAEANHTLTDDMVYDLLSKFPIGVTPDALFMSRRSLHQLRNSRTATNATGAPAPIPTEVEGVPIVPTDNIVNTEALTL